ncbi:PREDICTED: uncharacterized protein LOC107064500 [Polistes dominula]|uniref:Uncharacterized protein LOC107064500 n=1 Tax=Polistes dominula TaxID=743375 RepID=A0ABM1HXM6_POLDO|nr:PREDICTED: uncharacterized protein LOC107064500 [Polistes dominula]
MLLWTFVRTAFSASLGAVVQIVILVLQSSATSRVQATLPPGAEDEIILIEHLPGRRVHLQDFFWTGIDDAPPWVDPNQGLTFYETRTVHHTVTIYSPNDQDDKGVSAPAPPYGPECTTCINPTPRLNEDNNDNDDHDDNDDNDNDNDKDQDIGVLIGEDPGPRYWLLTVLRAGESVPQKVELKLARLYRIAFSRQQQRHLGLLSTDPRARRATKQRRFHEQMTTGQKSSIPTSTTSIESSKEEMIQISKRERKFISKFRNNDTEILNNILNNGSNFGLKKILLTNLKKEEEADDDDDDGDTDGDTDGDILRTNTTTGTNSSSMIFKDQRLMNFSSKSSVDWRLSEESNKDINSTVSSKLRSLDGVVQVRMHNTSTIESEGTRLIYSVHLGGKPVPAETAARDMALLSSQEVALELGVPVIIRSEPYIKETRPLALSRKRDVWLLVGAAGAAVILLGLLLTGLILIAKRKRAHSAVVAPPNKSILKKERDYVLPSPGIDNATFLTPDYSEGKIVDGTTSQRQTPRTLSKTPDTTADSLHRSIDEFSTDNEEESKKPVVASPWSIEDQPSRKTRVRSQGRMMRTNAIDPPRTPDSMDTIADHTEMLESLENGYPRQEEVLASPRSYLSMPSCKQFPSMRSVEPLSRVLEPVTVKHLDVDSPESGRRRNNGYARNDKVGDSFLTRSSSTFRDPGVVGPIVWTLRRQGLSTEGNGTSEISDVEQVFVGSGGPVGRARRRLHELLEDSFSLFGSREPKPSKELFQATNTRPNSAVRTTDALTIFTEGKYSPTSRTLAELSTRPRTSVSRRNLVEDIPETGHSNHPRGGTWGSRPLSAGPFHKPNLPEVDTKRILVDSQLSPEDPAVPLISSIKKELDKFSP